MPVREPLPAKVHEIVKLFSGRRRSHRLDVRLSIEVNGATRAYRGRTLNASQLGALIEIDDPEFLPTDTVTSLMDAAEIVRRLFPTEMTIRFWRMSLSVEARVVRIAQHPSRLDVVLGCEFVTPLTPLQCRAIGIVADVGDDTKGGEAADTDSDAQDADDEEKDVKEDAKRDAKASPDAKASSSAASSESDKPPKRPASGSKPR